MPGRRPAGRQILTEDAGRRPNDGRRARVPGLDGLRGIGIAAVVLFHLNPSWLPGGYLGVDIFFVVSGFLITGLLLDLFGRPGRPPLSEFWARRARRLLPGLVVLLIGVAIAAGLFARDAVPELRADTPAALAFVANWRFLLHHDNYFQAIGRPPLLQHLWSLGVEEQFYLLWPFVVLFVLRVARRPARALCVTASVGAVASALLMAVLFVPGHPSAVYYGTLTHAAGLLIGAALAAASRGRRADAGALARKRRAQLGAGAVGGLLALLAFMGSGGSFAYRGGIFLASGLTGLLLLISLQPGPVQRALCARPLRYLGTRSYSLYLWHWPVICLTRPDLDVRLSGAPLLVLRLALIFAGAEASYRFVEQPWRTGRAQAALRALRSPGRTAALGSVGAFGATAVVLLAVVNPPPLSAALLSGSTPAARVDLSATTTTAATVITPAGRPAPTTTSPPSPTTSPPSPLTSSRGPTSAPPTVAPARTATPPTSASTVSSTAASTVSSTAASTVSSTAASTASSTALPTTASTVLPSTNSTLPLSQAPTSSTSPPRPASGSVSPAAGQSAGSLTVPSTHATEPGNPPSSTPAAGRSPAAAHAHGVAGLGRPFLAVGDSVLLAASTALEQRLHGGIVVDAKVSRQVYDGLQRLSAYRTAGDLKGLKAIVIDLGTNGPMYPDDVSRFRQLATGVPLLVFVNVRVPRPWQSTTNNSLAQVAKQPGIRVVNWYAASGAPGVLWSDGVHPDIQGQAIFANLVAQALAPAGPAGT